MKEQNYSQKEKVKLINWARSCHFDWLIAMREHKQERWMSVLSYLEIKFDFSINDHFHDKSWKLILNGINSLTEKEIVYLIGFTKRH